MVEARHPKKLKPGDHVRFVSPASPPERESLLRRARILESWGLVVEYGAHVFSQHGFLAGRDEERLADLNDAFRDPKVRAVITTRGGRGSYRIADQLDFEAVCRDPKFLVGFSDITALHLSLWQRCRLVTLHGALTENADGEIPEVTASSLRNALMGSEAVVLSSDPEEGTARLTRGDRAEGILLGGNLEMIGTAAGWSLPDLRGAILLVEAVEMPLGQVDRLLTRLVKSGCLAGLRGLALGQFVGFTRHSSGWHVLDLLEGHLGGLGVPILGGLPLGHGENARTVPLGLPVQMDASGGRLILNADCSAPLA